MLQVRERITLVLQQRLMVHYELREQANVACWMLPFFCAAFLNDLLDCYFGASHVVELRHDVVGALAV